MEFEWDEDKRRLVRQKHGVDLKDIALMFEDPITMEIWPDPRDPSALRRVAIGLVDGVWYELAFEERGGVIRLITGWKLNERSRRKAQARHARRPARHEGARRDPAAET